MAQFLEKIKETLQRDAEILRKEFHLFGRHFNLQDDVADGPVSENPEHREKAEEEESSEYAVLHCPNTVKELSSILSKPSVDPNTLNDHGDTPLHSLLKRSFKNKSQQHDLLYTFLAKSDVDVDLGDAAGNTPLHIAVERRAIKAVKMLIAFGAKVNSQNKQRKTPLDLSTGRHTLVPVTGSMLEIIPMTIHPTNTTSEVIKHSTDELVTLLKDCDAVLSSSISKLRPPPLRKQPTIRRFTAIMEDDKEQEEDTKNKDDWCTKIAKMNYRLECSIKSSLCVSEISATSHPSDRAGCDNNQLSNIDRAAALGLQIREMKLLQLAGSRLLFLDGGGMKGLLEIDILCQIEEQTGRKITELFDWIIGNSTGAIIALAVIYGLPHLLELCKGGAEVIALFVLRTGKKTLREVRRMFFNLRDHVFGSSPGGIGNTKELTKVLKDTFGDMTMDEVKFPRVMVSAVHKKTTNLKLHFFSNYPGIDELCKERLVWKVARYTSAAPVFFDELDDYVDGGILANNPSASGLTTIQSVFRKNEQKLPISLVVSMGTGQMPEDELGRTDAHQFLFFGKHWLTLKDMVMTRASNLITLLGNAITESEHVSDNVRSRCEEQGIDYYRFSPRLHEIVGAGETDRDKLIDMIIWARRCSVTKHAFGKLMLRFPQYSDANWKMSQRMQSSIFS